MIEPPQPGFTGVVWPARPAARLARELATGPGTLPMAEAAVAWTRLATAFGTAVLEYEKVVTQVREAWGSRHSSDLLQRVSALRDWLVETTEAAAANAALFQAQVGAYEVARLAMPHTAEIEQIQQVQRMLESIGNIAGAAVRAVADDADRDSDMAQAVASRVMETYEKATEPLALAWRQAEPPVIVAEPASVAEYSGTTPTAGGGVPAGFRGLRFGVNPPARAPRVPGAYQAPIYTQSASGQAKVPYSGGLGPETTSSRAMPVAPGAAAGGVAGATEAARFPRAGLAGPGGDHLGAENELRAAPAVLGGVEPAPAPEGRARSSS
ncbi:PPE domain-containing protein [Nocardia sp. CA-290969]|uniref:PPE domain-containing protein n=1 Tax=Nocardia sp. CA-290969 TaxID=3239986 RepID=UPI003D8CA800